MFVLGIKQHVHDVQWSTPDSADASGSSPQSGEKALPSGLSQPHASCLVSIDRYTVESTNPSSQENPYSPFKMHETHLEITHTQRDAQSVGSK